MFLIASKKKCFYARRRTEPKKRALYVEEKRKEQEVENKQGTSEISETSAEKPTVIKKVAEKSTMQRVESLLIKSALVEYYGLGERLVYELFTAYRFIRVHLCGQLVLVGAISQAVSENYFEATS